jgi:hypothetical protein
MNGNGSQKVPDLSRLEIGIDFVFLRLREFLIAVSRLAATAARGSGSWGLEAGCWKRKLWTRGTRGEYGWNTGQEIAEYLRLEKWKRLKTRRLFGFLIPDLRLEMQLDDGW